MKPLTSLVTLICLALPSSSQDPCRSGLPPGQRPGPYSAVVCTGPERGKSHCYVCETADRPNVIIFARALTEPLGKLAHQLDKALAEHKGAELRGWITILAPDQAKVDADVVKWGRQHALAKLPLAVFEDVVGPPSYRIAADADVTILLSVKQKVVANFAFRAGELSDARAAEVIKTLPQIVGIKN
jgi:hypothetical protein